MILKITDTYCKCNCVLIEDSSYPLISVIGTLERRQLAMIRAMSLNQKVHDPRTPNGTAAVAGGAHAVFKDVVVAGLIAQPMIYCLSRRCWDNFVQNVLHVKK